MPKTATAKDDKTKRSPSAYNQFMKDHLSDYKEKHPDLNHKEAFAAVAAMWKDAPENPNKGKSTTKKTSDKENATSKPKSRPKKSKVEAEEDDEEQSNEE
ncbi:hypothetical protein Clacol_003248 [Clathrus columnatus]|uniref:HMG box domain-containing protein n=1 Tax=Clathrus columnatus TaxID=1419009 RepID=A0AAV5A6A2_9AGAM|nr:hypothetical protein Clacol_003248 [Clathrus columnatus]